MIEQHAVIAAPQPVFTAVVFESLDIGRFRELIQSANGILDAPPGGRLSDTHQLLGCFSCPLDAVHG